MEHIHPQSDSSSQEPENNQTASSAYEFDWKDPRTWFNPGFKMVRNIFLGIVLLGALGVVIFITYATWNLPPMQAIEDPQSDLSTQLISSDGYVLQKYYTTENRVSKPLSEISPYIINGLIATEDVRFYAHTGIDPKYFFSIAVGVLKGDTRGGSTIDMQLARNLYREIGDQGTIVRKIREYVISAILERRFTKEEILAAYLNTVNIYGTSYGVETTANRLFDKKAKDLTVEEAALMVGMLKGQGVYNPFRYPERSINRRNTVINQMAKYGVIEDGLDLDSIKAIPLNLADQSLEHVKGLAPYFREHVREELAKWCEENGYNLYTDGLRVYTTLDSRMQRHAETAMKEHLSELQKTFNKQIKGREPYVKDPSIIDNLMRSSARYRSAKRAGKSDDEIDREFRTPIENMKIFSWDGEQEVTMSPRDSIKYYSHFLETGVVSIDPTNGHVKTWVGGIDYKHFKYDHVAKGKRQVGSTFKPFVYGAAIENGRQPCDPVLNQQVFIDLPDGTVWSPKNSEGEIGGLMTLKGGLAASANMITASLMKDLKPPAVVEFAHRMGIDSELDPVPSLCLGTTDLSVFEMAKAYSTFANQGLRIDPVIITRIEDKHGNVLAQFVPQSEQVLQPDKAHTIVEMLKNVVNTGTGIRLRYKYEFKNEIGGKTGTTQQHSDGWFMGITPNLVTGVWVGNSDRRMHFRSIKDGQGANMALPIFALYMQDVYADQSIGLPPDGFLPPEGYAVDLSCPNRMKENQQQQNNGPVSSDDISDF